MVVALGTYPVLTLACGALALLLVPVLLWAAPARRRSAAT